MEIVKLIVSNDVLGMGDEEVMLSDITEGGKWCCHSSAQLGSAWLQLSLHWLIQKQTS